MSLLKALNLPAKTSASKPGAAGQRPAKLSKGSDQKEQTDDDGPPILESDQISTPQGTTKALIDRTVADTARRVEDRALALTTQFMALVLKACDDFRTYSKSRIKKLEDEVTAGDLLQGLATAAVGMIGGELAGKVGNKVGKALVDKMVDLFKEKVPKAANPKGKELADLTGAVDALVTSMSDKALLASAVTETVGKRCDEIIEAANAGHRLTPDQEDFLGDFYEQGTQVDKALERFGIPSGSTAARIYLKVYRGLVKEFEKQLYMSQYTSQDRSIRSSHALEGEADAMADKAAQAEEQHRKADLTATK